MRLPLDPGDVLGDGCWETVKRVFAVISTLWVGAITATVSYYLAQVVLVLWAGAWGKVGSLFIDMGESLIWAIAWAPFYFLFSFWGFVLVPILGAVMFFMLRAEREVIWLWYFTVVATGLMAMSRMVNLLSGGVLDVIAWIVFVLIMVTIAAGCWLLGSWRKNSQAQHLQEVNAENELRRLEIEQAYGTKSFGQDNIREMNDES